MLKTNKLPKLQHVYEWIKIGKVNLDARDGQNGVVNSMPPNLALSLRVRERVVFEKVNNHVFLFQTNLQISVSSRRWYAILCDTMSTACHTRQARCLHAVQLRGVGGAGWGRVGGLVRLWRTTDRNLTAPPAVYTFLLRPFRAGIMRVGNLPRPGCLKNCRCATAKKTPPTKKM